MIGPILVVIALIVVIPVGVMMGCAVVAAGLGFFLKDDVDRTHEGSELIATNR